jgi:twinkle protein
VDADDLDGELLMPTKWGLSLPWPFLTNWTYGMRGGEVWVLGAGTGIGKSDLAGEIATHLIKPKEDGGKCVPIAMFNYEAGPVRTLKMLVGKLVGQAVQHPPPKDGTPNFEGFPYWQPADMEAAGSTAASGAPSSTSTTTREPSTGLRQGAPPLPHPRGGIRVGFVDPVAALVAQEDDDRKALDRLFAEAKALAEELDITILFNSHLTRPPYGKSHEEGGRVELRHFRGSGAITMWASYVFGMERNQQSDEARRSARTPPCACSRTARPGTARARPAPRLQHPHRPPGGEGPRADGWPEPPPLEILRRVMDPHDSVAQP